MNDYLTLGEFAALMRISYRTAKRHKASGLLRVTRISPRRYGVSKSQLAEYLDALGSRHRAG